MPTYKQMQQRNPEYEAGYWQRCRALYAGGRKLLANKKLMREIFPPHLAEEVMVYEERLKRAYYIPYAGQIIDFIVASLFGERLTMTSEPPADPYYTEFFEDVSPPGGRRQTFNELLKEQVTTALVCRRAWTLVDLPSLPSGADGQATPAQVANIAAAEYPDSLADEEASGQLDAYAVALDPECVWDWEMSEDGLLLWALVHYEHSKRDSLAGDRSVVTEEWYHYTNTSWEKYAISYTRDKPPQENDEVPLINAGSHSFGSVPLITLELTDGLWAMGKIEPIAVAHLNKRNALTWAEYKSLFPVMAHFAGPPDPMNPITEDPNRAVTQRVGQGRILQFGDKDDLRFVGPDSGPFQTALADLAVLRDEMHRVVHQMAQSVDNSAAALQRSGESKQVDQAATAVVLRALSQYAREHAVQIHEMAQLGRRDAVLVDWEPQGMESFDETTLDSLVVQATSMELISVPSATFQQVYKFTLAKRLLGEAATDENLDEIRKELESNIANEQFDPAHMLKLESMAANSTSGFEDNPPAGDAKGNGAAKGEKQPAA